MRISELLANTKIQFILVGLVMFLLGGTSYWFVAQLAGPPNQPPSIIGTNGPAPTGFPSGLPSGIPTPDKGAEGKQIPVKDVSASPAKYADVSIILAGKIVQLTNTEGTFLRDPEGYTIRLNFDNYKGPLANTTDFVKVTGKVILKPGQLGDPVYFEVSDITKG